MLVENADNAVQLKPPSRVIVLTIIGAVMVGFGFFASQRISAERRPLTSPPVKVDPRLGIASARLAAKPVAKAVVFVGDQFPLIDLDRPAILEEKFGRCEVSLQFYDRNGRQVTAPIHPGPYGAVVEILPKKQRPIRRFLTLYRLSGPLQADERIESASASRLAEILGVPPKTVERHAEILEKKLRKRPNSLIIKDPAVSRLFAGLALVKDDNGPPRSWNDAEAAERRWWLDWKRKSGSGSLASVQKLEIPKPVFGSPALRIREGTLAEAGMKPESLEEIDALLQLWAADSDQGFAVCIVRKGVIVMHRAYGMRDGKPMTVDTKSWMASVTKLMSATLMMMLVDEGLVSLDDRIADILPQLTGLTTDRPITIRRLYTHTHNLEFWLKGQDELSDFEERVADCYPSAHAGRVWFYNGVGYTVGGKIIERLSGETIPEFYRTHLLGPLGMEQTDVTGTHADARSVPLDMARFGQMLLNGGAYGDCRFFRPSTFRQMMPHRLTSELGPDSLLVWGIGLDGDSVRLGHGAASSAILRIDRESELVVVMTRDKRGKNFERYEPRFWEAIYSGIR